MKSDVSWVIPLRSMALAKLVLTERDDIELIDQPSGVGFDLLVRVHGQHQRLMPEFAVKVKGTGHPMTPSRFREWIKRHQLPESAAGFPLVLFGFDIDDRTGMYSWLVEPQVVDDAPVLRSVSTLPTLPSPRLLDPAAIDDIVTAVITWTRAQEALLRQPARAS